MVMLSLLLVIKMKMNSQIKETSQGKETLYTIKFKIEEIFELVELLKSILNLFEWLMILKIDSFTRSFRGRVFLSFGSKIFFPLKEPDIILIIQQLYNLYLS